MWRHAVAILAALAITLLFFEFWGQFSGAMSHVVQIRIDNAMEKPADKQAGQAATKAPMPIAVIPSGENCTKKNGPCPNVPDTGP